MPIDKITTHIADAKERLIQQYKDKPNFLTLLESCIAQVQNLEDGIYAIFGLLSIENSIGEQLDRIGEIVGQKREGKDDEEYRLFIYARIGINISTGKIEELLFIWRFITKANLIYLMEIFPAGIAIGTSNEIDSNLIDAVFDLLEKVSAAGVAVDHVTAFEEDNAFAFDDSNIGNPGGFGDTEDAGIGGKFAMLMKQK